MSEALPPITLTHGTILGDEVYACIGSAILDGRLGPGERLRDVDLAAQLGVSRTPVREALQRLERCGLVEVAVGRYTRVSEPVDQLRADTLAFSVYTLGNALRIALNACDDDALAELVDSTDAAAHAARDGDPLRLYNAMMTLFEQAVNATGNLVLIGVIREASLALQRNLSGGTAFLDVVVEQPSAYDRLRESIARRDADTAEQTVRTLHGLA
ncbi:MAG: GntR family transcriptional regulator [Microbacterium sp.]|nr:MAG: GntR family transcriptional regulator [Microbacterium sp.]